LNKKIRKIENIDQAKALAYFLQKEKLRHLQDVEKINADLTGLRLKWGIDTPEADVDDWWAI